MLVINFLDNARLSYFAITRLKKRFLSIVDFQKTLIWLKVLARHLPLSILIRN